MSGNDELMKGMAMFSQGLSQYNQSKALESANQKLGTLNSMQMDKEQKLMEQTKIQQDLAMRLGMAGADSGKIQALTNDLAPSVNAQYQAGQNKDLQQNSQAFQAGEKSKDRAHETEMQQMKLDAMGFKDSKKEAKAMAGFADKFRKENSETVKAMDKFSMLEDILKRTPDRVGVEMAKTGLLKAAGEDRVSDTDVQRAQRDPSLRASIARRLKLEATGEALKDDRVFYQAILKHAKEKLSGNLRTKVKGYATGTAELAGVDATKLESGLMKQLNLGEPGKTVTKKLYSPSRNKTKIMYSDGSEEVIDGQ